MHRPGRLRVIELNDFIATAQFERSEVQLSAATDGSALNTRIRRTARWAGELRKTSNSRTNWLFVESLRRKYGSETERWLNRQFGLEDLVGRGKPLKARTVREVVFAAERMTSRAIYPDVGAFGPNPDGYSGFGHELACEMRKALDRRYANSLVVCGDSRCLDPVPERVFLRIVKEFNAVMEDLHTRFPKLGDVEPPDLSQSDARALDSGLVGAYVVSASSIQVGIIDSPETCWENTLRETRQRSGIAPATGGLSGVLMHEYAHHLALGQSHAPVHWLPRLAAMLRQNGFIREETSIDTTDVHSRSFGVRLGKKAREMGLGSYAGSNASEFAAEALTWRMAPGYGASADIPRMPRYLEDWVHDCFPFTRDGPIPVSCHEFDPASVREPAMVGGSIVWRDRGRDRTPPPGEGPR